MDKLTDKQRRFCEEYMIDMNATQAAIRAGYGEKYARQQGTENLAKPVIQGLLAKLMQERSKRTQVDADWVLTEAVKSFKFNAQEVFDNEGNPKMVNAPAAAKFLEMTGKHVDVKAFEKDTTVVNNVHNIMPVPQADSVDDWESAAQAQQDSVLNPNGD